MIALHKTIIMFGRLDNEQMEQLLQCQYVGRIGCSDGNTVYVVPIGYAYDGTNVYAHSAEGMKIDLMRANPNVCFEVDDVSDVSNWQSVIGWGVFEELSEGEARLHAIRKLAEKNIPVAASKTAKMLPEYPFYSDDLNEMEGVLYRIKLEKKTGRFEKHEAAALR